jgi:hypothetical protein
MFLTTLLTLEDWAEGRAKGKSHTSDTTPDYSYF